MQPEKAFVQLQCSLACIVNWVKDFIVLCPNTTPSGTSLAAHITSNDSLQFGEIIMGVDTNFSFKSPNDFTQDSSK